MPNTSQKKRFLTTKEFCLEARISRTTLYRYMKQGFVPITKIGHKLLIPAVLLDRLEEIFEGDSK
ncbi:MAG: helix-turn-helix domain-containing protein [Spirochaetales bacterium]|jgi:predicted DNA-binding transcriptional regulator AlpA|nr:helix-turn-helix domain-containing protein [Spirochaetales bacterium]